MMGCQQGKLINAIFITFSGNCRKALSFYQTCFGGHLEFETFEKELRNYTELPVVSGSLIADSIIIYGSDLVHTEGRKVGNYIAIYLHCRDYYQRRELIRKLEGRETIDVQSDEQLKLIEISDAFDVRWILGV